MYKKNAKLQRRCDCSLHEFGVGGSQPPPAVLGEQESDLGHSSKCALLKLQGEVAEGLVSHVVSRVSGSSELKGQTPLCQ